MATQLTYTLTLSLQISRRIRNGDEPPLCVTAKGTDIEELAKGVPLTYEKCRGHKRTDFNTQVGYGASSIDVWAKH